MSFYRFCYFAMFIINMKTALITLLFKYEKQILKDFLFSFLLLSAGVSAQPGHKLLPAEQEIPLNYGADRLGKTL